ncbi:glycosyltransferase family 2 protein [Myroides odoratimimus]|uniref:glycosyltransferase family 2 protein n=1 Tax=Myroides odoratimimus TaxID=76832 RepID=UPI00310196D1
MLVSIIVPIYNGEQFLEECIVSMLNQDYTDYEIILINDGSTDNTEIICNKFKEKDSRIKYFYQENAGVSVARNNGIKEAKGEWLCFVDSDDYLEPCYLSIFLNALDSLDSDVLIVQELFKIINGNKELIKNNAGKIDANDFTTLLEINNVLSIGYSVCKFYKLSIVRQNNIFFDKNIKFAEDLLFMLEYIKYIDHVVFVNGSGYNYRILNNSASTKIYSFNQYMYVRNKLEIELDFLCIENSSMRSLKISESLGMFSFLSLNSLYVSGIDNAQRIRCLKELVDIVSIKELNSFINKRSTKIIEKKILFLLFNGKIKISNFLFKIYFLLYNFIK